MRTIKKHNNDSVWNKYTDDEDIEFETRAFPFSNLYAITPGDSEEANKERGWRKWSYGLVNWKGLVDENNEPLECNEENKRYIYDWMPDITLFVFNLINDATTSRVNNSKN